MEKNLFKEFFSKHLGTIVREGELPKDFLRRYFILFPVRKNDEELHIVMPKKAKYARLHRFFMSFPQFMKNKNVVYTLVVDHILYDIARGYLPAPTNGFMYAPLLALGKEEGVMIKVAEFDDDRTNARITVILKGITTVEKYDLEIYKYAVLVKHSFFSSLVSREIRDSFSFYLYSVLDFTTPEEQEAWNNVKAILRVIATVRKYVKALELYKSLKVDPCIIFSDAFMRSLKQFFRVSLLLSTPFVMTFEGPEELNTFLVHSLFKHVCVTTVRDSPLGSVVCFFPYEKYKYILPEVTTYFIFLPELISIITENMCGVGKALAYAYIKLLELKDLDELLE